MITFSSTNNKFTATIQGDASTLGPTIVNVYSLSKTMLRIRRYDLTKVSVFAIAFSGLWGSIPVTNYYSGPDGVVEIPLRNIVNQHIDNEFLVTVTMYEVGGNTAVDGLSFTMDSFHGISYFDMIPPRVKDSDVFSASHGLRYILPPNVIINPSAFLGQTPGVIVESNFHASDVNLVWSQIASGISSTITPTGYRDNQIEVDASADTLQLTDGSKTKAWKLEKPSTCADLIAIRWTSLTGAVRQHFFPVTAFIDGNDKTVSLVSSGDGYEITRNAYKGVRCKIDGLTTYGYWYYMDLIQASDAHAIMMPSGSLWSTEMANAQTACYIEGNDMETPQGVGFYSFEFTVKLRHYDTV